ncbi:MAG: hypothetical protein AAF950_18380 [Pseudomonadota bacterium]
MRGFGRVLVLSLLAGCVSRVQIAELEANSGVNYYASELSKDEILNQGLLVADGYLALADKIASTQDGVSVFNILLASGAALAVINDASTNGIARIGVAGVAVNQTTSYYDPATATDALTNAAKRQYCIVGVGRAYAQEKPFDRKVIADSLTRVRLFLRADLRREPNNYSELFEAQSAAQKQANLLGRTGIVDLQTELNKCVTAN